VGERLYIDVDHTWCMVNRRSGGDVSVSTMAGTPVQQQALVTNCTDHWCAA